MLDSDREGPWNQKMGVRSSVRGGDSSINSQRRGTEPPRKTRKGLRITVAGYSFAGHVPGGCDRIAVMQQGAAGVDRRKFLVDGLSAGFSNADDRPGYDKEAAQEGWKRLWQWFKKYGAA